MNRTDSLADKRADLAGPGVSTYEEVAKILPDDYQPVLDRRETQKALYAAKRHIEDNLAKELNLMMVQVPLIVSEESGVNDMLDRDGSRTPVQFPCGLGLDTPIRAQVVQAATKWKRVALEQFGCAVGEGINTDMRAVRKDCFLDHDHSAYVDQWEWERVIRAEDRNLAFLTDIVTRIWKVITGAERHVHEMFPSWPATGTRGCPRSSPSCTRKRSSSATPTCRASSGKRRFSGTTRRSSSTASAGRWPTATRTRCGPRTTTTG